MGRSVIPLSQGFDYQARFFWLEACRLFEPHSKVDRVAYEVDHARSFDDIVVYYDPPIIDARGEDVETDYYQIKFHVNQAGTITCDNLADPAFIGAESVSLLQRLQEAQKTFAPGSTSRFTICSPWPIGSEDALGRLVSTQDGEIRLGVLFDGSTPRSAIGGIRAKWKRHLGLECDDDLCSVLRSMRIHVTPPLLELTDLLNDKLRLAGLRPIQANRIVNPYDDLITKLVAQGNNIFSREDIQRICEREGLWIGNPSICAEQTVELGIRSFMRWAEHMEDQTDAMLCLVRHFDNRHIRAQTLWNSAVFPEIETFVRRMARPNRVSHLRLDTHSSIAYAAGYCLDSKSGLQVVPFQSTRSGTILWNPSQSPRPGSYPMWTFDTLSTPSSGNDIALAISVTHDTTHDVQTYVTSALPDVSRIITCTIDPNPGASAIQDGTHAQLLVDSLVHHIRQARTDKERAGVLHLFSAAPNGFLFFFGRTSHSLGRCMLYEYDFDTNHAGAYEPSLTFPPP